MSRSFDLSPETLQKDLARLTTARAIRAGVLVREPCQWPGCAKFPVDAHHEDYSDPFNISWFCPPHHREHHRNERAHDAAEAERRRNLPDYRGWIKAGLWGAGGRGEMTIPECFL